jgi:hypothetical protein
MKYFLCFLLLLGLGYAADSKTVPIGKKVTISVTVSGVGPFTYQWKKNGADIPDAKGESYVIPVFAASHAGNYTVAITNSAGTARSDIAEVKAPTPPSGTTTILIE